MKKLQMLRKECPDIFSKDKDAQIRQFIDSIKVFGESSQYKLLRKNELRNKLMVIKCNEEK